MPDFGRPAKECGTGRHGKVSAGRQSLQNGWYRFASNFCEGKSVLDVGAGMGIGLKILRKKTDNVTGIDLDERLKEYGIEIKNITDIPDKSFDVVTCIDVIEHIQNDKEFVEQLKRVAKELVILSTPNFNFSKCKNGYHWREYTPEEFVESFSPTFLYTGTAQGGTHKQVVLGIDNFMQHLCGVIKLN